MLRRSPSQLTESKNIFFFGRLFSKLPGEWIQSDRQGLAGGFLGQPSLREVHPPQEVLEAGGRSAPGDGAMLVAKRRVINFHV